MENAYEIKSVLALCQLQLKTSKLSYRQKLKTKFTVEWL